MTDRTPVIGTLWPDDWRDYRRIRLSMLADAPGAFASNLADAERRSEADWRQALTEVRQLAARQDGALVGAAGLHVRGDMADLIGMWVTPAYRGPGHGGVARLLVQAVADDARALGHRRLLLDVVTDNRHARAFYERLGFAPTGRVQGVPGREQDQEVQLALWLSGQPEGP